MTTLLLIPAVLALAAWLYLLLGRGGFWRSRIEAPAPPPLTTAPPVVAVVPARDEADLVGQAVGSLLRQDYPGRLSVVLVDDGSTDGTADRALEAARALGPQAADRLLVVRASPTPRGWAGKVWAMAEGLRHAGEAMPEAAYVLFTDADILHPPDGLARLVARAEDGKLDLVSLMVRLSCVSLAERALIPAFVFFFAMLYPFDRVADRGHRTAAAAGGCMLARRTALASIGGLASIRGAIIDDCALAAAIKPGGAIWLGHAHAVTRSLRRYEGPAPIWRMIARSAYTQLGHSPALLAATVAGMLLVYVAPPVLALLAHGAAAIIGAAAWLLMALAFLPMIRLYGLSPLWAPALPLVALFYVAATIDSARRFHAGHGGEWKGRAYGPAESAP
jgi:hopene-associated glycosyltransferase HpnB